MGDAIACADCRAFYLTEHDALMAACASVGIEMGQSKGTMLRLYLDGYHEAGHDPDYAKETR